MSKGDIEEKKIKEGIENCYSYDCGVKILEYAAVTAFINSLITKAKEQTARDIYEDIGKIYKESMNMTDFGEAIWYKYGKHINKGKGVE